MKKTLRTTAWLLLLATALFCLFSCSDNKTDVYRAGNISVTEGMYSYMYSCYKYLYRADCNKAGEGFPDTEEGWQQKVGGVTHAERFQSYFDYRFKTRLVAAYLYENQSNKKPSSEVRRVLSSIIETTFFYSDADTTEEYNELLSGYGADYEDMFLSLLYEYEHTLLFSVLYGAQGAGILADTYKEDVNAFYRDNYTHIRYLVIENSDADAEKKKLALLGAASDKDFDTLVAGYAGSENCDAFFYKEDSQDVDTVLFNAAFQTPIGQNDSVTLDNGNTCVFRRYALKEEYRDASFATYFNSFTTVAASYIYSNYLESCFDKIEELQAVAYNPWENETCVDENVIRTFVR